MFAIVLVIVAAVGIAWPFLKKRGLIPAPVEDALQNVRQRLRLPTPQTAPVSGPSTPTGHTEQLCPQCTALNRAGVEKCGECGAPLLAEKITDLWSGSKRNEVIEEAIICGVLLGIVLLAMALSHNLPVLGKMVIILCAILILTVRFVKNFGE
jgi:hypothetical protein